MGNKKANPRQKSLFQGEERVGGIRWSGGIIGVGIIPPIKIGPEQSLIDTKEFDLVIGGDRFDLSIVQTGFKWDLIPFPMMKNTEESQGGYEKSDEG